MSIKNSSLCLSTRGDLQWNAGEKKLTGGANWQPKVAPATWSTGGVPSGPLVGASSINTTDSETSVF